MKKQAIKKEVKSCRVSSLIEDKKDNSKLRLSLEKPSKDTRIRSSLLDIFIG